MNGTGETTTRVVTEWTPEAKADFRQRVTVGRHNLHERPEFSDEALARLIDRHPQLAGDVRRNQGYLFGRASVLGELYGRGEITGAQSR